MRPPFLKTLTGNLDIPQVFTNLASASHSSSQSSHIGLTESQNTLKPFKNTAGVACVSPQPQNTEEPQSL